MRRSPLRHPLAVLRQVIGLSQMEMADVGGCSRGAIQSIELGRLAWGEELAMRIADGTNASLTWLLRGDAKAPVVTEEGEPYQKEFYEMAQGRLLKMPKTKCERRDGRICGGGVLDEGPWSNGCGDSS